MNFIRNEVTEYGFNFGAATVTRVTSDKKGGVAIAIVTLKSRIEVCATKTGKVRLYRDNKEIV